MPYVVMEGTEGAGKTTLLRGLKRHYPNLVHFREPGGTPITAPLREYLLQHLADITPLEQLMMFTTDRVLSNIIALRPALLANQLVIGDRSFLDTLVYQCLVLKAIDPMWYLDLLRRLDFPWPDLVLDLRLDPAIGCARRDAAGDKNDFDRRPLTFHVNARAAMDRLSGLLPDVRFVTIDASLLPQQMLDAAIAAITTHLGLAPEEA